jgi:hypothetical protein
MKSLPFVPITLAAFLGFGAISGAPTVAKADTTSTLLIAAGAAAIVGALLYDGNNRPYYVRSNHRYYVTQDEAQYYRGHHHGYVRSAYIPEQEYPVARDPYHPYQRHQRGHNGGR